MASSPTRLMLEALVTTTTLFVAHALPINSSIEKAMAAKRFWSYPAAYGYYFVAFVFVFVLYHWLLRM
jgi:hypothetical protein